MKGFKVKIEGKTDYNVYDIEVQDNHSFLADKLFVHNCGIFVAKKKYIARVWDSEGVRYTEPYTKVMGLELIKSGTPKFTKLKLKESIGIMLDYEATELIEWLDKVKEEFTQQIPSDVCTVAGVSNLEYKLTDKAVPIGARSSIVHNDYIDEHNLGDKFTKIRGGDKTKRLYLVQPNPLNSNVVAFLDDRFIDMFKDYIDWDVNFEKGFLKPLELMTDALGWDLRHNMEVLDEW